MHFIHLNFFKVPQRGDFVLVKHYSFEILQEAEVSDVGDGVATEIKVLEVNILLEIFYGLDVIVGKAEPC